MEQNLSYQYCCRTVTHANALWRDMCAGKCLLITDIRLRRKRDERVRHLLFDEIRRAFLTPIDRDDLWGLCVTSEDLLQATEEVAAELCRQERERLPDEGDFWAAIGWGCATLQQAVISFPRFQRQDDTVEAIRRWDTNKAQCQKMYDEQAKKTLVKNDYGVLRLYDFGVSVVKSGDAFARQLLTAILKNE